MRAPACVCHRPRPQREREVYLVEVGSAAIELPAAEVDQNDGRAKVGAVEIRIEWQAARASA